MKSLRGHLRACSECREAVDAWRGVMTELETWQLPDRAARAAWMRHAVRWAVAAILLIGLGYGIGRFSTGSALERTIRRSLRRELTADLNAAVAAARSELQDELRREFRSELSETASYTFAASNAATNRLLSDLIWSLEAARREEFGTIAAVLEDSESRRLVDHALLRNDLETLAELTGDELLRTNRTVAQVLAYSQAMSPIWSPSQDSNIHEERRP